jgi:hypothetical protein
MRVVSSGWHRIRDASYRHRGHLPCLYHDVFIANRQPSALAEALSTAVCSDCVNLTDMFRP